MRAVAMEQSALGGEGSLGGSGGLAFLVVSALMLASSRLQASTIPGGFLYLCPIQWPLVTCDY